jgi:hypothetical protein
MNATQILKYLKGMVEQKNELKAEMKDLKETIKINNEQIDNTILDEGEIGACRKLLEQNLQMLTNKKKLSSQIKLVQESIEKTIMGDGTEGQSYMFDEDEEDPEEESAS